MREVQDIRAWNEEMVKKYDVEAYYEKSNFAIRWVEYLRIKAILNAIRNQLRGKILEVGCGAGHVLAKIPRADRVGIDLSNHMVQRAQARLKGKNISILQANADHLPFQEKSFDGIICTEVLEHVENPEVILKEISRVAKAKASIALSIPNENIINRVKDTLILLGLGPFFFGREYKVPERMNDEWHLHVFELKEALKTLQTKFWIRKVIPIPSAFIPLRYVIDCSPRS